MVNLGLTRGGAGFYRGTSGGLLRGDAAALESYRSRNWSNGEKEEGVPSKCAFPRGWPLLAILRGSGWARLKGQDEAQGRDPVLPCP